MDDNNIEEEYHKQWAYYEKIYPNKKINIQNYGLVDKDTIRNKRDLFSIIKNFNIRCSYCNKKITNEFGWVVVFHNLTTNDKDPINVLFFCRDDKINCANNWAKERYKKNN